MVTIRRNEQKAVQMLADRQCDAIILTLAIWMAGDFVVD